MIQLRLLSGFIPYIDVYPLPNHQQSQYCNYAYLSIFNKAHDGFTQKNARNATRKSRLCCKNPKIVSNTANWTRIIKPEGKDQIRIRDTRPQKCSLALFFYRIRRNPSKSSPLLGSVSISSYGKDAKRRTRHRQKFVKSTTSYPDGPPLRTWGRRTPCGGRRGGIKIDKFAAYSTIQVSSFSVLTSLHRLTSFLPIRCK
ncbi:hypothetical protein Zmor_009909 [Zophobas morio]|uniref:Uncharacterized protein n=1 Tax=Zophobas morio TaxID=2755281 RepID=A0AA38IQF1_9CUCU|nr:hypothetical protein Zmor_009909 [Zophobas morio]